MPEEPSNAVSDGAGGEGDSPERRYMDDPDRGEDEPEGGEKVGPEPPPAFDPHAPRP